MKVLVTGGCGYPGHVLIGLFALSLAGCSASWWTRACAEPSLPGKDMRDIAFRVAEGFD